MEGPVRTRPALPSTAASLWWLEQVAATRFIGWCRDGAPQRAFGGQVAAQALAAAGADLPEGWYPSSLHAYFVRAGRSAEPIEYRVDEIGDDATSALRSVTAVQSEKPILTLAASFRALGPGAAPAAAPVAPARTGPDPLACSADGWLPHGSDDARWLAEQSKRMRFELRFASPPTSLAARRGEVARGQRFWFRTTEPLPDDPIQHAYALTYASDLFLVSTALAVHGLHGRRSNVRAASLDHAIWFHRPMRADDWVLYEQDSPISAGGRGLSTGRLLDPAGELVATVRQEVLIRVIA